MATEVEIKRWVREEHLVIKAEEQAACDHRLSGTYPPDDPDNLYCDQCGKLVTMADYSQSGDQRRAHPRIPLR